VDQKRHVLPDQGNGEGKNRMPAFEKIDLKLQEKYGLLLERTAEKASDYSFINLWGWADEYDLSWTSSDGLVWIRQDIPAPCLWAPVGAWDDADWQGIFRDPGMRDLPFTRVPERLLKCWHEALPGRVHAQEAREHFDYLYSVQELVDLRGNRFHSKKNLLNQFRKKYEYALKRIDPDLLPGVLAMQQDWCTWQDCESNDTLAAENRVIIRVLQSWKDLPRIMGAAITVHDKIIAFTVAEPLAEEMIVIHFEKGLPEFTGIYQAINQMFLEQTTGFKLVNREQDLGDDGLRKSKLSYNPVGYTRKYHVRIT
jgi:hypothetical protein